MIADLRIIPPALPTKHPPLSTRLMLWDLIYCTLCRSTSASDAYKGRYRHILHTKILLAGAGRTCSHRSHCIRSAAGARRCCYRHSLCTGSSAAGARRGRCRHSLCTGSSAAGAHKGRCRRSLCTCSFPSGVHRCRCRRSLYTCFSALARLLGCRMMWRESCGQTQCIR